MRLTSLAVLAFLFWLTSPAWAVEVIGVVEAVSNEVATLRLDDGRTVKIDITKLARDEKRELERGKRVMISGQFIAQSVRTARAVRDDRSEVSARHHGVIEKVDGRYATLKDDDGRVLRIDLSDLDDGDRRDFKRGDVVTVLGRPGRRDDEIDAAFVREGRGWVRVYGELTIADYNRLLIKTDDRRTVEVDSSRIPPERIAALRNGEDVAVTGIARGGDPRRFDHMEAYDIRRVGPRPR
jgi:hypothetical protein